MITERAKPYIGVSGVVSVAQQNEIRSMYEPLRPNRRLALGVKAVYKTQWLDVENKYTQDWYPVGGDIADAVRRTRGDDDEMRIAQVFLDEAAAQEAGEVDYQKRFIDKLIGRTGHWLTGIQFDLLQWDGAQALPLFEAIKTYDDELDILVQCQGPMMERFGPHGVMQQLKPYTETLNHVLFDASHGTGRRLNVQYLRPFALEASEWPWLGVGIAGGLDGSVVRDELPAIIEEIPHLSIDAEGRLHAHEDAAQKDLNMGAVAEYMHAMAELYK